ncbi:MAG: GNAT family N-acetyltransferase [Bacteroidota bacterium]
MDNVTLRNIEANDCQAISDAFARQGWNKPVHQYEKYVALQTKGYRDVIIAECHATFAGYVTIAWTSDYPNFQQTGIPEIVDLNVLKQFQRNGIGTQLLDEAERRIQQRSQWVGIGFGLTQDYGAAQRLYIKRGYVPDGHGLMKNSQAVAHGQQVEVDDGLVIYLLKELS